MARILVFFSGRGVDFDLLLEGKLSTNGPPETSQSPCNPLFYDFQLRLHFVNCVPIFWIERSIASPKSAAIPTQSIQSKDNSVQCRIATTWKNPLQFNAIRHNWGELKVDCACLCDTNVMQVTKQYLKHQLSWKSKTHLLRSRNPSQSKGVILQSVPLYHNYKKG